MAWNMNDELDLEKILYRRWDRMISLLRLICDTRSNITYGRKTILNGNVCDYFYIFLYLLSITLTLKTILHPIEVFYGELHQCPCLSHRTLLSVIWKETITDERKTSICVKWTLSRYVILAIHCTYVTNPVQVDFFPKHTLFPDVLKFSRLRIFRYI